MRRPAALLLVLGALSPVGAAAQAPAEPPPAAAPAESGVVAVAPGLVLPRLEALAATRSRPLFSPSRRPPPPPPPAIVAARVVEEAPPEPEKPPPFVLAGVVTGNTLTLAMLQNRDTSEVARVRRGEAVLGWTVTEVGTKHVVLQRDGRSVRLALFEKKEEPAAAAGGKAPRKPAAADDEDDEDDEDDDE